MQYLKLKTTLAALSVGAMFAFSGAASAVTLSGAECGNKWIGLSQAGTELTPSMCQGGNSTGSGSPIAAAGWTDLAEVDGSETVGILTLNQSAKTWSVSSASGYSMIGISIKQGNGFAFFELDLSKTLSGMFGTGNSAPDGSDISHVNAWGKGTAANVVPLPAGGWMLLAGIGGLMAMRRRKKA